MEKVYEGFGRLREFIWYYICAIGANRVGVIILTFVLYPILLLFVFCGIVKMFMLLLWDALGNKWFRYVVAEFRMLPMAMKELCDFKGRREYCQRQLEALKQVVK